MVQRVTLRMITTKQRGRRFRYLGSVGVLLALVLVGQHRSAPTLPNVMLAPELSTGTVASTTSTTASNGSTTVSTLFIPKPSGTEEIVIKIVNRPKVVVDTPQSSANGTSGAVSDTFSAPPTTVAPTTTEPPTTTTSTTTTEANLPKLSWTSWSYGPYWNQNGQSAPNGAIFMPLGTLKLAASVAGLPKGIISFSLIRGSAQMANMNGPDYYGSNDCSAVHNWSGQASGGCAITFNQSGTYNVRVSYGSQSLSATVNVS